MPHSFGYITMVPPSREKQLSQGLKNLDMAAEDPLMRHINLIVKLKFQNQGEYMIQKHQATSVRFLGLNEGKVPLRQSWCGLKEII